jgi:hypothetical protein
MTANVQVWEKDPASGVVVSAPYPDVGLPPFDFTFPLPVLPPDPGRTTPNFRYWNAAEAAKRGIDFWVPTMPPTAAWYCQAALEVRLDLGPIWNATYDRLSLNFYTGQLSQGVIIYSSNSADMVCHELGHAVLDAIRPDLWQSGNQEVSAFHEAFGDVSAILCALQVDTIRSSVMALTGGSYCSSRLSRIAEQFGSSLYTVFPDDAEPLCLRDAYNHFCYAPPSSLTPAGPSLILTGSVHSFSRIFSGALLQILCGMLATNPSPTQNELHDVTLDLRDIMIEAVRSAPLVPQYYAAVAAEMLTAAATRSAAYATVFRDVFVARLILSAETALAVLSSFSTRGIRATARPEERPYSPTLIRIPLDHYGFDRPVFVEAPEDPSQSPARSAGPEGRSLPPLTAEEAARTFLEHLLMRGLVDLEGEKGTLDRDQKDLSRIRMTHALERDGRQLLLRRIRVQSNLCMAA